MTKTELKKKTKDELIEMVKKQDETIKKLMDGKFIPATVGKMFVKSLDEKEQEVRHDVCKKIKIYAKTELKENLYISEILFFNYLDKIERGEV